METRNPSALTDREELLLSAYIDDECTSVERVKAEQLIKSAPAAKAFVDAMKRVGAEVTGTRSELGFESVNLWDRVSSRVMQEERTAVMLGSRQLDEETSSRTVSHEEKGTWFTKLVGLFDVRMALGSLSGAAVAACALFLINDGRVTSFGTPSLDSTRVSLSAGAGGNQLGISPVALGGNMREPGNTSPVRPRLAYNSNGRAVEVDWARGNGPLKFIQGPNDRSTIIWVKRRGNRKASTVSKFDPNVELSEPARRETLSALELLPQSQAKSLDAR